MKCSTSSAAGGECGRGLLGLAPSDRPGFFDASAPAASALRRRTGRPHWLVVDEAHLALTEHVNADAIVAGRARQHDADYRASGAVPA